MPTGHTGWRIFRAPSTVVPSNGATNAKRSTLLMLTRLGDLRFSAFSWWRRTRISTRNAARDRADYQPTRGVTLVVLRFR